ncbi:hypothetical protein BGZ83_005395, partial [Gryganskiella cystojenkinii]
ILGLVGPILNLIKNCKDSEGASPTIPPIVIPTKFTIPVIPTIVLPTNVPTPVIPSIVPTNLLSSLIPVPTGAAKCIPLVKPIKDLISQTLTTIEGLPLGPEASSLLKTAVGTNLSAYFDNGIDTVGSTSAILAATIPQLVDVIKAAQASLGPALGIADPAFQV